MLYASSPIGGPPSQKRAAVRFRGKLGFLQGHLRETASAEDFHPAGLLRTDSRAEGPPSSPRRKRRVDLSQTLSLACFLVFRVPNHPHESLSLPLLHFSIRQQVCSRISGPPALAKAGTATYVQNLVAMVHLPLVFSAWCLPAGLLYGIGGIAELPESSREVCAPSHALSYPLWLSFLHVVCGSHFLGPCHCHGHAWLVSSSQRGGSSASRPGCLLRGGGRLPWCSSGESSSKSWFGWIASSPSWYAASFLLLGHPPIRKRAHVRFRAWIFTTSGHKPPCPPPDLKKKNTLQPQGRSRACPESLPRQAFKPPQVQKSAKNVSRLLGITTGGGSGLKFLSRKSTTGNVE